MNRHDPERLVAFLAGDLSRAEVEAVDTHLLECRECWQAVYEDSIGRIAAESVREVAPAAVRDRVRVAVSLAPVGRSQRRWRRRAVASVAAGALAAALLGSWTVLRVDDRKPDALALIVQQVRAATAHHTVLTSVTIGGRRMRVEEYDLDGGRVVVAYDTQPFPMPSDAHAANEQVNAPWSASVDGTTVLCFNTPRPALLVGDRAVSSDSLAQLAHRLALA